MEPKIHEIRYYQQPPNEKTLEACYCHGADHIAYHWSQQIDPRWSEEQVAAYKRGYAGENF